MSVNHAFRVALPLPRVAPRRTPSTHPPFNTAQNLHATASGGDKPQSAHTCATDTAANRVRNTSNCRARTTPADTRARGKRMPPTTYTAYIPGPLPRTAEAPSPQRTTQVGLATYRVKASNNRAAVVPETPPARRCTKRLRCGENVIVARLAKNSSGFLQHKAVQRGKRTQCDTQRGKQGRVEQRDGESRAGGGSFNHNLGQTARPSHRFHSDLPRAHACVNSTDAAFTASGHRFHVKRASFLLVTKQDVSGGQCGNIPSTQPVHT